MKHFLFVIATFFFFRASSQTTINQNGIQSTVIRGLAASTTQANRFEIISIGYNSFHWQYGGIIIIEIFQNYYSTDYKKYVVQNGMGKGVNSGNAVLKLVEVSGDQNLGRLHWEHLLI